MTEKKTTKAVATKKTATTKKSTVKKVASKSVVVLTENVGFKAGDVYQALATAEKALTIAEIAKLANITEDEVLVGMGWLFKEGKIKDEDNKVALA